MQDFALLRQADALDQGKCERIKNRPFPRQHAEFSRLFVRVFVVLAPFGLLDVFADRIGHAHAEIGWIAP